MWAVARIGLASTCQEPSRLLLTGFRSGAGARLTCLPAMRFIRFGGFERWRLSFRLCTKSQVILVSLLSGHPCSAQSGQRFNDMVTEQSESKLQTPNTKEIPSSKLQTA